VPLLGVEGVRVRLGERFRVLTGGARFVLRRHQTLRATFEFSHALLAEDERTVFRRLSVFTGSFGVEAAQALGADDLLDAWDVLRCLGALVDKSLVIAVGDHPRRLRLLETARAYALEQLGLAGETERYLERHAEVTADSIQPSLEEGWKLPRGEWLARYEPELEDMRAAVGWALAHRPPLAIQLIGDAARLWQEFQLWPDALRYCENVRPHLSDATAPRAAGRLRYVEAIASHGSGEGMRLRDAVRRAVALLRGTGDLPALSHALALLAVWALSPPDEEQWNALAELDALAPRAGHQRDAPNLLCLRTDARGNLELRQGRFDEARRHLEHARDLYEALGDPAAAVRAQRMVAVAHLEACEFEAAIAVLRTVLKPLADMGQRRAYMLGLMVLAWCLVEQRDADAAEAPLREAAPVLVAYGATYHFAPMIALYAAMCGRLDAAARLVGYRNQHPLSDRTLQPSPVYPRVDASLRKLLETVPAAQRDAWETEGATTGERELVAMALGDRVG
jgi:tetratricopeptide (TPR) repeat protein